MSEDRLCRLSRQNVELLEKVTNLELLKNHWYQELLAARREVATLHAEVHRLKAELRSKEETFEADVRARIEAHEHARMERLAAEGLGLTKKRDD